MAESIRAPDVPPSGQNLAGAALTTGAAVLTGLIFGRKGVAGLAAGVAAMAGAKLIAGATRKEEAFPEGAISTRTDLTARVHPPKLELPDWVDNDAVLFSHAVPDATAAMEMLRERFLPLLDDNGLPVDEVTVLPAYPATPVYDFPFGPIIWQAGRAVQSRSDSAGETVWFGMQDVKQWMQIRGPQTPALLSGGKSADAIPGDAKKVSASPPPPAAAEVHLIENAFGATAVHDAGTAPGDAPSHHAAAASMPSPFSTAAEVMRSHAATGHAPIITPRATAKSSLPQPRQTGARPKQPAESPPQGNNEVLPRKRSTLLAALLMEHEHRNESPAARGMPCSNGPGHVHRHLEPIAPSGAPTPARRWPLVLLLSFLAVVLVLVIADRLHGGALLRNTAALRPANAAGSALGTVRSERSEVRGD